MVILGYIAGISVGALFLGGVIPGILIGFSLMGVVYLYSRGKGEVYLGGVAPTMRRLLVTTWSALPALGLPLVILGGIFMGIFTATEAAAVAVFYGLAVELFVYREMKLKNLPGILRRSAIVSSMVMFIVAISGIFGWILTVAEFPQTFTAALLSISSNKVITLLLINILLLIAGMLLDTTAILLIIMPTLMPVATSFGIDPVHFGVVVIVNLGIGMVTPPVGLALFVACGLSKRSISTVIRPLLPIILAMVAVLILITYVPFLVTFLPHLMRGN